MYGSVARLNPTDCSLRFPAELIRALILLVSTLLVQHAHLRAIARPESTWSFPCRFGLSRHMTWKITGWCGNKRGRAWYELVTMARINPSADGALRPKRTSGTYGTSTLSLSVEPNLNLGDPIVMPQNVVISKYLDRHVPTARWYRTWCTVERPRYRGCLIAVRSRKHS